MQNISIGELRNLLKYFVSSARPNYNGPTPKAQGPSLGSEGANKIAFVPLRFNDRLLLSSSPRTVTAPWRLRNLVLITIFINHSLYVGYSSFSQCGTRVLQIQLNLCFSSPLHIDYRSQHLVQHRPPHLSLSQHKA